MNRSPDLANKGTHNSSVAPGKTVDSNITIAFFLMIVEIDKQTFSNALVSGLLFFDIGVGTVTIKTFDDESF